MNQQPQVIFDEDEIAVILRDEKAVFGRLIKPQPKAKLVYCYYGQESGTWGYSDENAYRLWGGEYKLPDNIRQEELTKRWTPPCCTGDVLNVQETFSTFSNTDKVAPKRNYRAILATGKKNGFILRVLDVRMERFQDIVNGQAEYAEMIQRKYPNCSEQSWFWVIEVKRIK